MYLYYLLSNLNLNRWREGSGQPLLNQTILKSIEVTIPCFKTQKAIAHILGTLDDKIELNRQTNKTLEAIAKAIFKSWFVDFDPVHYKQGSTQQNRKSLNAAADEKGACTPNDDPTDAARYSLSPEILDLFPDSFQDSELGEIPAGWAVCTVDEIGEVVCGKTPSTKVDEYYGQDIPFVTIPDMHNNLFVIESNKMLSKEGAESQSKKTLPVGSICVSCIATPGLVILTHRECQTNQQINSVIPHDKESEYYWYCLLYTSDAADE